jgi:uncharacterized membrane protein YfcA
LAILSILFFVTALIYALIGFGGGSTYNALLVLAGVDFHLLPTVALSCNLIVVSGGVWHHSRAGNMRPSIVLPFMLTSVPLAWIGGMLTLSERTFVLILGASLLLTGLRMLTDRHGQSAALPPPGNLVRWSVGLPVGGVLGLLAGMVGIGGGVFLAPILLGLRWGNAREVAGAASLFILVNSAAGLLGQTIKLTGSGQIGLLTDYLWLFPAVLIGGQIGSHLSAYHLPERLIRRLTAALVIYVAARLLWQWSAS